MITTRQELTRYLASDKQANGMTNPVFQAITFNDNYPVHKLLRTLRFAEYYGNIYQEKGGVIRRLFYLYYMLLFRRWRVKTGIMIFPNTIGPGVLLMHPGFRRIDKFVRIGANCTILPMVLFGRKHPNDEHSEIYVGDNCYISTGVTILGPVKIGNYVTIGAGAVVTKDVPDNAVVGGVPAKILKMKQ